MTTYTNPDDATKTYTLGQRGKRPAWVIPMLSKDNVDLTPIVAKEKKVVHTGLYQWSLRGPLGSTLCVIVAEDELEAHVLFNKTSTTALMPSELHSDNGQWKRSILDNESSIFTKGVWVKNGDTWVHREPLTRRAS